MEDETDNWNTQKPRRESGQRYQARDAQAVFIRGEDQDRPGGVTQMWRLMVLGLSQVFSVDVTVALPSLQHFRDSLLVKHT